MKGKFLISLCVILVAACSNVKKEKVQETEKLPEYEYIELTDPLMEEAKQLADEAQKMGVLKGDETPEEIGEIGADYYFDNNDYDKAARFIALSALLGNLDAQRVLGSLYANGEGVTEDEDKAFAWYNLAAERGDADAQLELGCFYAEGTANVPKDFGKAMEWWRKSAEQGYADAQYFLGMYYIMGEGVPKNVEEGMKWVSKAAAQGHEKAKKALTSVAP